MTEMRRGERERERRRSVPNKVAFEDGQNDDAHKLNPSTQPRETRRSSSSAKVGDSDSSKTVPGSKRSASAAELDSTINRPLSTSPVPAKGKIQMMSHSSYKSKTLTIKGKPDTVMCPSTYPLPENERWLSHKITEEYVDFVGNMMYPKSVYGPFGHDNQKKQFPINRVTALGFLLCPLRRPTVVEKWSPYEIAVFESSLMVFGKDFNQVQKNIQTKSVKEIIEFYYMWKKTNHYKIWKDTYISEENLVFEEDS